MKCKGVSPRVWKDEVIGLVESVHKEVMEEKKGHRGKGVKGRRKEGNAMPLEASATL